MSHYIEQRAVAGDPCVVLSAFQHWSHFTPDTIRRCEQLVRFAQAFSLIKQGDAAWHSDDVEELLHRQPHDIEELVTEHAALELAPMTGDSGSAPR